MWPGGDYDRHAAFLSQTRAFHRDFNACFLPMIYAGDRMTAAYDDAVPRQFAWRELSLQERLKAPLAMLGALGVANVVMVLAVMAVYRRLRTRLAF